MATLADILGAAGEVDEADLVRARGQIERHGGELGDVLVSLGVLTDEALAAARSRQYDLPLLQEALEVELDGDLIDALPSTLLSTYKVVPLRLEAGRLVLALADPGIGEVLDDLARLAGRPLELHVAPAGAIVDALRRIARDRDVDPSRQIEELRKDEKAELLSAVEEDPDLLDDAEGGPAIRLVNLLFTQAVRDRASDIHIEPYERSLKVRLRVDGVLHEAHELPRSFHASLISRLKVMADLDIAERRLPQDGRIRLRHGGADVDVRVSILPSAHGERAVLRLLPMETVLPGLGELGLSGDDEATMRGFAQLSEGLVLVTGPTGSGKTTTLYALLELTNDGRRNILTVEDPVEYQLEGVGQVQVNPKIGLTFAAGLRSILRQDPDVILIGEIRDGETAAIAIQSALTGHLVLSTVHTNDAVSAVTRLVDMGIEPFLLASTLRGLVAQRLVRRICRACREERAPRAAEAALLGELAPSARIARGRGCAACLGSGYRGRVGLFECLQVDDEIQRLIAQGVGESLLREAAGRAGMTPLWKEGLRQVAAGVTTLEEVMRVAPGLSRMGP